MKSSKISSKSQAFDSLNDPQDTDHKPRTTSHKFRVFHQLTALFVGLFFCVPLWVQAQTRPTPTAGLARIWGSVADNDRPTALYLNPAGLAFQPAWGLHYLHTDVGSISEVGRGEGDALFVSFKPLSFLGLGVGLQILYPELSVGGVPPLGAYARLTLGSAFRVGTLFSFGLNFHAMMGDNQDIQGLFLMDAGLVFRPWNFLSLGVMARNLNAPMWSNKTTIPRSWELGLSLRPLGHDRWLLSADIRLPETGQGFEFIYRMQGEPVPGWIIGVRARHSVPVNAVGLEAFMGFRWGKVGLQTMAALNLPTQPQTQAGWAGWTAGLWYSGSHYRSLYQPRNRMPLLDISGSLPERTHGFPFGKSRPLFMRLILAIERARQDKAVSGLLVRIGSLRCGLAKVQELRQALLRFKRRGKKVIVYLNGAQMKAYYLASVADKIFLNPTSSIWVNGLATQHLFLANVLKKIGITPQYVKFGKYKTGPNRFTQSKLTPAHREASEQLLDDLFQQIIQGLAHSRKVSVKKVNRWLQTGIHHASLAKTHGLVDDVLYWDEMWKKMAKLYGSRYQIDASYFKRKHAPSRWKGLQEAIAVIHVDGAIVSGTNQDDPLFGVHLSGASTIIQSLIQAQYNSHIRAVVLRVDSPGGEVLASDLIWRYVGLLRKVKPVVVSMGSVAASGGYYISAPAHKIIASPATITGSIGIYAGKFDLSGLLKKIGANFQSIKRGGPLVGLFHSYTSWTPQQRKLFKAHIKVGYTMFLKKVATGRKMKVSAVHKVAAGRVWSGVRAKKLGLVDELGGLWTALREARALAGIAPHVRLRYLSWPTRSHWRLAPLQAIGFSVQQATPQSQDPLAQLFTRFRKTIIPTPSGSLLPQLLTYWQQLVKRLQTPQLWAITSPLLAP